MSQIDRLAITGIRAFDPSGPNGIQFYTPLTLIVGHNGAGKTTVIECLKYATTGDMPPNCQRGAFIHDPRVAGEVEVKAQVKLRFKNVNGKTMVCTRSLSLTNKGASMTMKTLEGVLQIQNEENPKEKISISTRCAELDIAVPEQLGVSRAVLENVVFCHQEDSLWPLGDPATLKKKFDDIFASTRYTKALENIKSLKKDQQASSKGDETHLSHLAEKKTKADEVTRELQAMEARIFAANERKAELEAGEIEKVSSQLRGLEKEQQGIQKVEAELRQKEMKRDLIQGVVDELTESITVLDDSDDRLQQMLSDQQKSVKQQQSEMDDLERKGEKVQMDLSVVESSIAEKLTRIGQLKAEADAHQRRCSDREKLIREISRMCNIRIEQEVLDDAAVRTFAAKLEREVESRAAELETAKARFHTEEKEIMDRKQKAHGSVSAKEESRLLAKRQLESARVKVSELTRQLLGAQVDSSAVEEQRRKILDEEMWLESAKEGFNPAESEGKVKALSQEIQSLELNMGMLNDEMAALNMQTDTRARLGLKTADKRRKEDSFRNRCFRQLSAESCREMQT
ncbi:AAA domain-containing protein [Zopfochytrium polystomum]|nr:AAA domain-containing protein [Zopfochytrium polystomum]